MSSNIPPEFAYLQARTMLLEELVIQLASLVIAGDGEIPLKYHLLLSEHAKATHSLNEELEKARASRGD